MSFSSNAFKEAFDRDGVVHVPGVFSHVEIAELRAEIEACQDDAKVSDLLSLPSLRLRRLVEDPRIIGLVRTLIDGRPVYFGDSTVLIGTDRFGGWHKDNADRYDGSAPDWQSPYDVLRFGIYLQDHSRHSGGLQVRLGSHNHPNTRRGKPVYMRTRPGDMVLWNLRTSHAGHGVLLNHLPTLHVHSRIGAWVNQYRKSNRLRHLQPLVDKVFAPTEQQRFAIFCSYGRAGAHLDRLLQYMSTRNYWGDRVDRLNWRPDEVVRMRDEGELAIVDPRTTIDPAMRARASADYKPPPR
jgi:hypothetical protein